MEFGEQLTAPALHVASSSTSSSSAPPKAAPSECVSQDPGAAGGSSLNSSCGTANTQGSCAPLLKDLGTRSHRVLNASAVSFSCCSSGIIWCSYFSEVEIPVSLQGHQQPRSQQNLKTQVVNICKSMHFSPISDCVPYLCFYTTTTTKANSIWQNLFWNMLMWKDKNNNK